MLQHRCRLLLLKESAIQCGLLIVTGSTRRYAIRGGVGTTIVAARLRELEPFMIAMDREIQDHIDQIRGK